MFLELKRQYVQMAKVYVKIPIQFSLPALHQLLQRVKFVCLTIIMSFWQTMHLNAFHPEFQY